jgi:hypothetical protein
VKILPIIERANWQSQVSCSYIKFYIVSKCTFVTDNGCRCRSVNLPFYQAKLLLCRFVTTKFSPLVEFAGISNAAVTQADCTMVLMMPDLTWSIWISIKNFSWYIHYMNSWGLSFTNSWIYWLWKIKWWFCHTVLWDLNCFVLLNIWPVLTSPEV